jgi:hypothetical protein
MILQEIDLNLHVTVDLGYPTAWREFEDQWVEQTSERPELVAITCGDRAWIIHHGRSAKEVKTIGPDEQGYRHIDLRDL